MVTKEELRKRKERLQKYLSLIRTTAGWSTSELGEKLGVSRQMISNLENGRNETTVMQYRAIRNVLSEEIEEAPENEMKMLNDVIRVLVDFPENYSEEEKEIVLSDAKLLAPSIVARKTTRLIASEKWCVLAGALLAATVAMAEMKKTGKSKEEEYEKEKE